MFKGLYAEKQNKWNSEGVVMNFLPYSSCQGGPAAPCGWNGSHGCEGDPASWANSWLPLGSRVACVCLRESCPETGNLTSGYWWKQSSIVQQRHCKRPCNSHCVVISVRFLVAQAVGFPTSEMCWELMNRKEQHSWGKCWEKPVFHSTYKNQSPFFILNISVTSWLFELEFTCQMIHQCISCKL